MQELIDRFLEDAPRRLGVLQEAAGRGDVDGVVRAAHGLRGSAGVLGATAVAEICTTLEERGRDGSVEGAGDLLAALESEMGRVTAALEEERERSTGPRRAAARRA